MAEVVEHSLSPRTIILTVLAGVVAITVWQLTSAILIVLSALLLATALNPLVQRLHKYIPVSVSAIVILIGLFLPLAWVVATVVPNFFIKLPSIIETIGAAVSSSPYVPPSIRSIDFTQYADNFARYAIASTAKIAEIIVTATTLIFLTYYIIIDREKLRDLLLSLVPENERGRFQKLAEELANISGQYIRGNLLISIICTLCIFVGLVFLGIPYAGQLAVFAGVLDLFPLIGAVGGSIPAVILGFLISPFTGFMTFAYYLVYQEIENHYIAPVIYNKALNLMPTLTLVAVVVGGSLFGIAGAFLSLPIAAGIPLLIAFSKKEKLFRS